MGSPAAEARAPVTSTPWRLKVTFWLDATLVASVCALQALSFTGLIVHEWLGLAIIVMVFAHLLFSWSWIASQTRRVFARHPPRTRINYLLNLTLFACVTAAIFSGILISQHAIPVLTGTKAAVEMDWRRDLLHEAFSGFLLLFSGFHLAMNWEWLLAAAERLFGRVAESGR